MKTPLLVLLLCCLLSTLWAGTDQMKEVPWSFVPVSHGTITIDSKEWVDIAVIEDTHGLAAFNAKYGVDVKASKQLFTKNIIVVVFSDIGMGIDGVGQSRRDEFCISMFDIGINVEMVAPPPGKRYASLQPISLPKQLAGGRIFIRKPQMVKRIDFKKE